MMSRDTMQRNPYAWALLVLITHWVSADAVAQETLDIEFVHGPVLYSNRIIGLGGAFVSVSEGADSHLINPASYAMRYNHVREEWFDWDWSLYWLNVEGSSPELSGSPDRISRTGYIGGGLDFRFSRFGVGLHVFLKDLSFQGDVGASGVTTSYQFQQALTSFGVGYALPFDFTLGIAIRGGNLAVLDEESEETLLALKGGGLSVGGVWAPTGKAFRIGLSHDTPLLVSKKEVASGESVEALQIASMRVPGRLTIGASWMFWGREYNPPKTYGVEGARPVPDSKRRYVLIAADLVYDFASEDAVGALSFLAGEPERSGEVGSFSPRMGVESEFWENRMRARVGTYYEPSRIESLNGRVHGTAGLDLRVHLLTDWRLNAVVDLAPNYYNWGLGIGFWN